MADDKQKGKAAAQPKSSAAEALFEKAEHLALARAMYGSPKHVVAAAIAVIEAKSGAREAFAKSEVVSAIKSLATAKVQKGE